MTAFSDYLDDKVLGVTLLGSTFTAVSSRYLSLATSLSSDGAVFVEPSSGGYARQAIVFGSPSGNPSRVTNSNTIAFPTATATWGSIVGIGIHNHPTAGNLLYHKTLDQAATINTSAVVQILPSSLSVTVG